MSAAHVTPSKHDLHLLRFLVSPSSSAIDHWNLWVSGGDIDDHSPTAYLMFPAAYKKLVALGADHEWMPRLRGVYRKTWASRHLAVSPVHEAIECLSAAGIDVLLPNERALLALTSSPVQIRDERRVVVRWQHAGAAVQALIATGWSVGKSESKKSLRRQLTVTDLGVVSPEGGWIQLSDHLVPGRSGKSISDRVWAGATPSSGRGYVPDPRDLAFSICASDPELGTQSIDCPMRLAALASVTNSQLEITTSPDPRREIDALVEARVGWFEALGAAPVSRRLIDDYPPLARTMTDRLRYARLVSRRWNGLKGMARVVDMSSAVRRG